MNEEMMKSLVSLIDETIAEVEELKKSDRFSASEIKLDGPGSGIGGQDPDGKLGKEEAAKGEDEDKDDKDEDKKEDKDMDKAEGQNPEADPNGGDHKPVAKADDDDDDKKEDEDKKDDDDKDFGKAEGKNREADPNGGNHQPAYKSVDEDSQFEEKLEKSLKGQEDLFKSYVDEKISPIEGKLETMMNLIKEIADAPVESKGQSYKDITPLKKSNDEEAEPLNKSKVIDKLFELKKSGEKVDTVDITSAELASPAELSKIASKYDLT